MLLLEKNAKEDIDFRRYRTALHVEGIGYMAFGIWSVIKVVMSVFLGELAFSTVIDVSGFAEEEIIFAQIAYAVVIFVIMLVVLIVHCYIGISAIKFSRGKKKSKVFLVVAGVLILMNIMGLPSYRDTVERVGMQNIDTVIASAIADITVILLLINLIYSAVRLSKMSHKMV